MDDAQQLLLWRWSTIVQLTSLAMATAFFALLAHASRRPELRSWARAWFANFLALAVTSVYWVLQPASLFPLVQPAVPRGEGGLRGVADAGRVADDAPRRALVHHQTDCGRRADLCGHWRGTLSRPGVDRDSATYGAGLHTGGVCDCNVAVAAKKHSMVGRGHWCSRGALARRILRVCVAGSAARCGPVGGAGWGRPACSCRQAPPSTPRPSG